MRIMLPHNIRTDVPQEYKTLWHCVLLRAAIYRGDRKNGNAHSSFIFNEKEHIDERYF